MTIPILTFGDFSHDGFEDMVGFPPLPENHLIGNGPFHQVSVNAPLRGFKFLHGLHFCWRDVLQTILLRYSAQRN